MKSLLNKRLFLWLSISSGLLLTLSWPARGLPLLAFLAFVPLLYLEDLALKNKKPYSGLNVFLYSWLTFGVFNLLTTWWIFFATPAGMLVAVVLNSLLMAIPWWLMHLSRKILPGQQGQASIVLLWLSFEYLHSLWDLSWNWLDLGNVFATLPYLVQWYEFTGTAGGAMWILLINLLLYNTLVLAGAGSEARRKMRKLALGTLLLVLIPSLFSIARYLRYQEASDPIELVVIQPSHDPYDQARTSTEIHARIQHMIRLADSVISPETRLVIAPEGASPSGIWKHEAEYHPMVRALRTHLHDHATISWIFGSIVYKEYPPESTPPPSARLRGHGSTYIDVFNSALMLSQGLPLQYYHKSKLVPGIEQMPFHRFMGPLGRLVERFGGTAGSMGTQDYRGVFLHPEGLRLAPAVCYESVYGDYMTEYFRRGAGLIVVITNDGWWRNTPGHRQHLHYSRLRAIEARRSVARSASTGISALINQRGDILQRSQWWEDTAIRGSLNQNYTLSFYSRSGNFLGRFSSFLSILLLLYMLSRRMIRPGRGFTS